MGLFYFFIPYRATDCAMCHVPITRGDPAIGIHDGYRTVSSLHPQCVTDHVNRELQSLMETVQRVNMVKTNLINDGKLNINNQILSNDIIPDLVDDHRYYDIMSTDINQVKLAYLGIVGGYPRNVNKKNEYRLSKK